MYSLEPEEVVYRVLILSLMLNVLSFLNSTGLQDQVPSAPQSSSSPAQAPLHHQETKHLLLKYMLMLFKKKWGIKSYRKNLESFIYFYIRNSELAS